MALYVEGNIFESPAQTLVNTTNTVGVMGKGLAKDFKRLFPEMFKEYQKLCESGEYTIGNLWLYRTPNKWVLNFPTKKHWKNPSKLEYIEKGLQAFVNSYDKAGIYSIAFPKLGCGNGELDWDIVKPLMEQYLTNLPIDIYIYVKNDSDVPEHKDIKKMKEWLRTEPRYLGFAEVKEDIESIINDKRTSIDSSRVTDEGLEITKENGEKGLIRWKGEEYENGLLELWQALRSKGFLRINDANAMGIPLAETLFEILLRLDYVKPFLLRDNNAKEKAIRLYSTDKPKQELELFSLTASS